MGRPLVESLKSSSLGPDGAEGGEWDGTGRGVPGTWNIYAQMCADMHICTHICIHIYIYIYICKDLCLRHCRGVLLGLCSFSVF